MINSPFNCSIYVQNVSSWLLFYSLCLDSLLWFCFLLVLVSCRCSSESTSPTQNNCTLGRWVSWPIRFVVSSNVCQRSLITRLTRFASLCCSGCGRRDEFQ